MPSTTHSSLSTSKKTAATSAATKKKAEPVKRSPAASAELVKVRRENLLRHMALWFYKRNIDRATGSDAESSTSASEVDFARLLDISKSYLSLIKSGGKQIHDKLAAQFERQLNLAPGELDQQVPQFPVESAGAPSAPSSAEDSLAHFTQTAQAAWGRLMPPQRTQLQRLLAQPGLAELLSFLQFTSGDNGGSTMKEHHAQHSQRFEGGDRPHQPKRKPG